MLRLQYTAFIGAVVLAGCITVPSKVVQVGPDTYMLKMTGVGFETQAGTTMEAMSKASDYCQSINRQLLAGPNTENGVYGWSPRQATLTFRCVTKDDPAYRAVSTNKQSTAN